MSDKVVYEWVILLIWDIGEDVGKSLDWEFSNIFVIAWEKSWTVLFGKIRKLLSDFLEVSLHKNTNSIEQISKNYKIKVSAC